jgi:hypothetical protein
MFAGISSDTTSGNMRFYYRLREDSCSKDIDSTHKYVEPLCYPLLFPYGERGWGSDLKGCDFMNYLANRLLMPEPGLLLPNKAGTRMINVNRFQIFSRLAQYYAVESVSRAQDYRLNWHSNNTGKIFGVPISNNNTEIPLYLEEQRMPIDQERVVNNDSNPSYLAGKLITHTIIVIKSKHLI